ncbi:MAG: hypothetical protein AAGI49_20215, partial [Bacteroidota bacterium]
MKNAILYLLLASGLTAAAFYSTRNFIFNDNEDGYELMQTGMSEYCETETLDFTGNPNSAIFLTIEKVDEQSMIIEIESATENDPVDVLVVNNSFGPITGLPAVSPVDDSVEGKLSITLTWNDTPPAEVEMNILWSKASEPGNWQIVGVPDPGNIIVPFDATCDADGGGGGDVAGTNIVDFPIDFECEFTTYAFNEFNGAPTIVADNPDATGINTSAKVAQMTKVDGAADFAGVILTLEDPIDFSQGQVFKMKTWSPKVGAVVKFKLENLTDGGIANEMDATTTVGNTWEELTFDFSDS